MKQVPLLFCDITFLKSDNNTKLNRDTKSTYILHFWLIGAAKVIKNSKTNLVRTVTFILNY